MYHSQMLLISRRIIRKLKLNNILRPIFVKNNYEEKFDKWLFSVIKKNHTVWDVGANIGIYTKKFAELASEGSVYCFEPNPQCIEVLKELQLKQSNINILPIALSSTTGRLPFTLGENPHDVTSRLAENFIKKENNNIIIIESETGDSFIRKNTTSTPTVIKIDVEGHELNVIKGLSQSLKDKNIKHIGIEVHFSRLDEMEISNGAAEIISILKHNGFQCRWIDYSHLVAERKDDL